ncbi:type II secretion system protein [bacterium]|nr:type II secretion system protein [bacterium]
MKRFNFNNKKRNGYNLIEIVVVLAISSILMTAIGLGVYFSQRNSLSAEQAGQELAGEIRLMQSQILAVQTVSGSIPKAVVVELKNNSAISKRYIRKDVSGFCNYYTLPTDLKITDRVRVSGVSPSSPIYIVFVSPAASFYAIQNASYPSFSPHPTNNSCIPDISPISSGMIRVDLTNESQEYYVKIDAKNGTTTPTAIP